MANFPTSIDAAYTLNGTDEIASAGINELSAQIVALQTKVGIDSSADTDSIDYKLANGTFDTISEVTPTNGVTIDSLNLKDGKLNTNDSVVTSNITDGAITNAKLNTTDGEPGGAWESWTPTLSNITAGDGTTTAKYLQVGKTVFYRFKFVLGSTSAIGSNPTFSLPVTPDSEYDSINTHIGDATLVDSGTKAYFGFINRSSSTGVFRVFTAGSTYLESTNVTPTAPHTWAQTDILQAQGFYEAA